MSLSHAYFVTINYLVSTPRDDSPPTNQQAMRGEAKNDLLLLDVVKRKDRADRFLCACFVSIMCVFLFAL